MPDFLYYGPLNSITGADVASRTGFGNMLFPYDNPYQREKLGVWYWPIAFTGPTAGIITSFGGAIKDLSEDNLMRAIERASPSFVRNPLKSFRYGTEGALNRNGVPIMEDIPLYSVLMQAVGFSPSALTKIYRENEQAKRYERAVMQRRSGLLAKLNGAKESGDLVEERKIRKQIAQYNKSRFGKELPINADTEIRSFKNFQRRVENMLDGVYINPSLKNPIRKDLGQG
jgi:hypothetical protein